MTEFSSVGPAYCSKDSDITHLTMHLARNGTIHGVLYAHLNTLFITSFQKLAVCCGSLRKQPRTLGCRFFSDIWILAVQCVDTVSLPLDPLHDPSSAIISQ